MASSCTSRGLQWILGKISSLKEFWSIGTGCPGKWWSPHPWRCSKNMQVWHFGTWFGRLGVAGLMISEVFSNLNDSIILWPAATRYWYSVAHLQARPTGDATAQYKWSRGGRAALCATTTESPPNEAQSSDNWSNPSSKHWTPWRVEDWCLGHCPSSEQALRCWRSGFFSLPSLIYKSGTLAIMLRILISWCWDVVPGKAIHLSKCLQLPVQGRWSTNKYQAKQANQTPKYVNK